MVCWRRGHGRLKNSKGGMAGRVRVRVDTRAGGAGGELARFAAQSAQWMRCRVG
jgi:hypothetical protein